MAMGSPTAPPRIRGARVPGFVGGCMMAWGCATLVGLCAIAAALALAMPKIREACDGGPMGRDLAGFLAGLESAALPPGATAVVVSADCALPLLGDTGGAVLPMPAGAGLPLVSVEPGVFRATLGGREVLVPATAATLRVVAPLPAAP